MKINRSRSQAARAPPRAASSAGAPIAARPSHLHWTGPAEPGTCKPAYSRWVCSLLPYFYYLLPLTYSRKNASCQVSIFLTARIFMNMAHVPPRFYNQHQQLMADAANKTSAPPPAASAAKRVGLIDCFLEKANILKFDNVRKVRPLILTMIPRFLARGEAKASSVRATVRGRARVTVRVPSPRYHCTSYAL